MYFSSAHGMFFRIGHMLGHKTSLSKFKNTEIISSFFSDHNAMKLEINHKKTTEKHTKTWKLNNMLLNNEWANKIKEEIKKYLETNESEKTTIQKSVGHKKSSPKRKIHSITGLFQKTKKSSNKQSNFTLKGT